MPKTPRVLIIAGSDPSGGAGIQADIKTCTMHGVYASTAITALTVQNTLGVTNIHEVPPEIITQQIRAVLNDIGADVVKTGMLHRSDIIELVAGILEEYQIPAVIDPVMVAKGGARLLEREAEETLREKLLPKALVITPNLEEASVLLEKRPHPNPLPKGEGSEHCVLTSDNAKEEATPSLLPTGEGQDEGAPAIWTTEAMEQAIYTLQRRYPIPHILLKGGHLDGETLTDLLYSEGELHSFTSPRLPTRNTHGTGCTMASAIASLIARGLTVPEAVSRAHVYVRRAIETAPTLGQGHGPVNHMHPL